MTNLESLLKDISKIVVEEKTRQEEGRKRGEKFNIFNVLGLSRDEVRLHSAFLAELLNPDGNHGLGDKFLKAFIKDVINDDSFQFDSASAKPQVEFTIGNINEDYTKGGRIDILIQDKEQRAIIIENKIDAVDQPKQLLRYYNYIKNNPQYRILYLTKEGTEPKEFSLGGNKDIEYQCISYKEDIINWLEKCIEIAALHPAIREIIQQYRLNLQQILNIMSKNNKRNLIELLKSNMSAAIGILEVEDEIRKEVRRNFISFVLQKIAVKYDFSIYYKENFLNCEKDSILIFTDNKAITTKGAFVLKMWKSSDVYYGIEFSDKKYINIKGEERWRDNNDMFPFGFGWIDDAKGNCYWDRNSTIIQMQKEIELIQMQKKEEYNFADTIIAKEIDNQLKYVREKDMLNKLEELHI